jgi:hypothetical protein
MTTHALTLNETLEQTRLIHREARLTLVIAALDDRVRELDRHDKRTPEPLLVALHEFREELATVRARRRGVGVIRA